MNAATHSFGNRRGRPFSETTAGLTFASFTETAFAGGTKLTLTADTAHSIWIQGVAPGLIDAADFV
jgi:hypothetical protein